MSVKLNPYLSFRDNAREAMEFYHSVFGGKLDVRTFKDLSAAQDPQEENLVMHASLEGDNEVAFMGADTPRSMQYTPGDNFMMSLSGDDEALLKGYFEKLSEGGQVTMPLEKAIWGDTFGICVDKFGIKWLCNISGSA